MKKVTFSLPLGEFTDVMEVGDDRMPDMMSVFFFFQENPEIAKEFYRWLTGETVEEVEFEMKAVENPVKNPLVQHAENLYEEALNIMRKKNADYAGDDDPVKNFQLAEYLGVAPTENAIMVRLLDKVARLANGLQREFAVEDEKFHDTVVDLINYAAILDYVMCQKSKGIYKTVLENNTGDKK